MICRLGGSRQCQLCHHKVRIECPRNIAGMNNKLSKYTTGMLALQWLVADCPMGRCQPHVSARLRSSRSQLELQLSINQRVLPSLLFPHSSSYHHLRPAFSTSPLPVNISCTISMNTYAGRKVSVDSKATKPVPVLGSAVRFIAPLHSPSPLPPDVPAVHLGTASTDAKRPTHQVPRLRRPAIHRGTARDRGGKP